MAKRMSSNSGSAALCALSKVFSFIYSAFYGVLFFFYSYCGYLITPTGSEA